MLVTRDEVVVAPFAGIMFCVAATALISGQWGDLTKFEEYAGFATIVALGGGQTWLVFRGLLIGRLPLAWSKSWFSRSRARSNRWTHTGPYPALKILGS